MPRKKLKNRKKLGVNVDHVATLRQARGGAEPSPLAAALEAERAGADSITVHLREDRRHIQESDVSAIHQKIRVPLNLEMALNQRVAAFALRIQPEKICIVPEKRRELTTEGGLNAAANEKILKKIIPKFQRKKIEVSLFIGPDEKQILAAARARADAVEFHTGFYADARGRQKLSEYQKIKRAAKMARRLGLKVNAGHGLNYHNVTRIARIPEVDELNIGHSIVSRSVFSGMYRAVSEMKKRIRSS